MYVCVCVRLLIFPKNFPLNKFTCSTSKFSIFIVVALGVIDVYVLIKKFVQIFILEVDAQLYFKVGCYILQFFKLKYIEFCILIVMLLVFHVDLCDFC